MNFENSGGVSLHGGFWIYLAGLCLFPGMLAYLLYTKGLENVESSRASIVATIEPVMGTLIGFFFFGEVLSGWQLKANTFLQILAGPEDIQPG
ncbi:EamA family transporter [Methanosarcina hadiensis]|uniref:EamA family transporter n=1 Tax=Methanosarcina hadiensis TaxID=3078083 RepID=UPI00397736AB